MTHNMTLTRNLEVAIWSAATGDWSGFARFAVDGSVKVYAKYAGNFILQRWLPALGVFYLAISAIWHLPFGDEVNATIVAVATLLGTTLEIATGAYLKKKGGTN